MKIDLYVNHNNGAPDYWACETPGVGVGKSRTVLWGRARVPRWGFHIAHDSAVTAQSKTQDGYNFVATVRYETLLCLCEKKSPWDLDLQRLQDVIANLRWLLEETSIEQLPEPARPVIRVKLADCERVYSDRHVLTALRPSASPIFADPLPPLEITNW